VSDLNVFGAAAPDVVDSASEAMTLTVMLRRVMADHSAIERSLENLRADPRRSAQILLNLTVLLTDHCCYLANVTFRHWTLDPGERAVTFEDDRAEIALIIQYLQCLHPRSAAFRRSLEELAEAISWHIDAEEAALFPA
jgi:hypothetical protein